MDGRDGVKAQLFGLLVECPYGDAAAQCPLIDKRGDSLHDRLIWAYEKADHGHVSEILSYHDVCMRRRASEG